MHDQAKTAVNILKAGGVVATPTDTLYGLAASAINESAVQRVFQLKGRHQGMPLPILLSDVDEMSKWAVEIPKATWALVEHFWPGALTLILRKADIIPDVLSGGRSTVALRVPNHPVPRLLARELGAPITGTSANRSGKPGLTTAESVRDVFGNEVDLVIDEDKVSVGVASTVVDLSGEQPRILRHGAVTQEQIERFWSGF